MPSSSLKRYLEDIIGRKGKNFDSNFDIEWNLFSTLSQIRSQKCLDRKSENAKAEFRDCFMNKCKTKSEKINFVLKDCHFREDLESLFQDLIRDSGLSKENKKSAAVARYFLESAKRKIRGGKEDLEKTLIKYNMALIYCPYSNDATSSSDKLLYAKLLLKRSELICLNFEIKDALLDIEEGLKMLKELKGSERNLIYCKFLCAKSVYLDLMDFKEYEQNQCTSFIEKTIDEFKFDDLLLEKLQKYYDFLIQTFTLNKELIKKQFDNHLQPIKVNVLKGNSKLPGVSTSIDLCLIEGKGRCTRANQSIEDGSILFVEKPIVQWLRPTMYKFYCNNCLVKINYHFMTCFKCIRVKYCSSLCRDEAWDKYHAIECKFQDCLCYFGYGHLVLRIMLLFDQDQMMDFLVDKKSDQKIDLEINESDNLSSQQMSDFTGGDNESKEKPKSPSLDSLLENAKMLSLRSKIENHKFLDNNYWLENGFPPELDYQSFFSLFSHEKHLDFCQLISFCYFVSLMGLMAEKMKIIHKDDRFYYVFHSALLSHILKINFNCYSIDDHSLKLDTKHNLWIHSNDSSKIGIGVYLSSSIISHSCDCNANKLSIGSQIVIYANQNIRKGDEITHTYGPSYKVSSYKDRQMMLKNGYLFNCDCNACKKKLENVPNSFRCQFCQDGPLLWNKDNSNECIKCGVKNQELEEMVAKLIQIQKDFNEANDFLSQMKYVDCKKKLDYCKKVLKSIMYSEQKFDHLYRLYMDYYFQREKYRKASKLAAILAEFQIKKDGKESLESILYALRSLHLMVLHFQNIKSLTNSNYQVPKKNLKKLRENYDTVLDNFNQITIRQVKLVESSFLSYMEGFQHVENFLNENQSAKI